MQRAEHVEAGLRRIAEVIIVGGEGRNAVVVAADEEADGSGEDRPGGGGLGGCEVAAERAVGVVAVVPRGPDLPSRCVDVCGLEDGRGCAGEEEDAGCEHEDEVEESQFIQTSPPCAAAFGTATAASAARFVVAVTGSCRG